MVSVEIIGPGSVVTILGGELEITGYNGSICYCLENTYDENGKYAGQEERMLTLNEIAYLMLLCDGRRHRLIYEEEE